LDWEGGGGREAEGGPCSIISLAGNIYIGIVNLAFFRCPF